MKELVLSVLSRGQGHVVQTDSKRQYGRLEVCFEPEDYFIWKSQPPLLRLSSSGRLLSGMEATPPKTYSTRRGPLILYSEDFASSFPQPDEVNRKERTFRASRQEAEVKIYSLRDLTEATVVYYKKQAKVECHASITKSTLPDPKPGTKPLQAHQTRPGDERRYPNQTTGEETWKATGAEERSITGDGKTGLRTGVATPKAQIHPNPEFDAWEENKDKLEDPSGYVVAEHLTDYPKDLNAQWKRSAIETECGGEKGEHAPRPAYTNHTLGCSHLSKVPNERRQAEGGWHPNPVKQSDLHLPPIKQALSADTESNDLGRKAGNMTQENHKEPIPRLPDIHQPEISTEAAASKQTGRSVLKKVLVLLPGPMEQDGLAGLPEEKEVIEDVLCSDVEPKVESIRKEEIRPSEHEYRLKAVQPEYLIRFEPEEDQEHQTTEGSLPPFVSRRGLGKQCCMARYQRESADRSEPQPAVVRGNLPLELRECQKEGLLGTLIMGPAGEIICLSFWDSLADTEDHPSLEDAMTEHGCLYLGEGAEGVVEESWTISDQIEEQSKQTGGVNDKVEANGGQKTQTSTNSEAFAVEQRIEKTDEHAESQPYSRGDDITQQSRGRMQRPQPKAKRRSGSPPRPLSGSSTQKAAVSTPTAADEPIDKTKAQSQTESVLRTAKSRKSSKLATEDDPHIRNEKKQKFERRSNRVTDISDAGKAGKTNVDTESQDTSFNEETASGPTQKNNKNIGVEKAKSTKSQNATDKIKKKSKDQAAFVVGKPKQSQEVRIQSEKRNYSSGTSVTTASNRLSESANKSGDDYSCGSSEYNIDGLESSKASTEVQINEAGHSSDTEQNFVRDEERLEGHSLESESVAISREDGGFGETSRVSMVDLNESNVSGVSSRSHTAKSSSASTWSIRRSSASSDTAVYTPVQLNLFPRRGVPTHRSASKPEKSESAADAKSSAKAVNARESRVAAALAAKAERHRMEVEKKRKEKKEEKEEVKNRQGNKEETEKRMQLELEEERKQRTQQARLRKLKEEEEKQRQAEREKEGQKGEQDEMERERRMQEETRNRKRYQERLRKEQHEQEIKRAVEIRRRHEEEMARKEDEYRKLQAMDESERQEYLRRQQEEDAERRKAAEERRRAKEEAAVCYEEFYRQNAALEQNLQFHRGLFVETEGLKQKQTISRPWVFSYFTKLGLAPCNMDEE